MTNNNKKNTAIEIVNLSKSFKESNKNYVSVYEHFNLQIENGKITAILGPNGCGKSTLIDIILGLENVNDGAIKINNQKSPINKGEIGVVFQGLGLFPWLSVKENLLFGTKNKKQKTSDYFSKLADEYLLRYGLGNYANARASSLSGGMQQKLALARVFIINPEIFIFDEPFSSLDPFSKSEFVNEIRKINKVTHKTIVFVTHNIQEAMDLGQKIVVLTRKPVSKSFVFDNTKNGKKGVAVKIKKILFSQ